MKVITSQRERVLNYMYTIKEFILKQTKTKENNNVNKYEPSKRNTRKQQTQNKA